MFLPSIASVAGAVLAAAFLLEKLRRKEALKPPPKVVDKAAKPRAKPAENPAKKTVAPAAAAKSSPPPEAHAPSAAPRVAPRPVPRKVSASTAEPPSADMEEVWSDLSVLVETEPEAEPEPEHETAAVPVITESETGEKTALQLELDALDEELDAPPAQRKDPVQALLERLASPDAPPPKTVAKVRVKPRTPA